MTVSRLAPFVVGCLLASTFADRAKAQPVVATDRVEFEAFEVFELTGSGFGEDPDRLCVVHAPEDPRTGAATGRVIPFDVLEATDTRIRVRAGPVPPGSGAGRIHALVGAGSRSGTWADTDLEGAPAWVWTRVPGERPGMTDGVLQPTPIDPPPGVQWFFGEPPNADGEICLFLQGDWLAGSAVDIRARAHDQLLGIGHDLGALDLTATAGGTALECAQNVCSLLRQAFGAAGIAVDCTAEEPRLGVAKLTLSLPDGTIDWGSLDVCVTDPPPDPWITGFDPQMGTCGTRISIQGRGFDPDADNVSVVLGDGGLSHPLEVVQASPTEIIVEVPIAHGVFGPRPIIYQAGRGMRGTVRPPVGADFALGDTVWVWDRAPPGGPMAVSEELLQVEGCEPTYECFFSNGPENGALSVSLDGGNWLLDSDVLIRARLHDRDLGIGHDLYAPSVLLPGGGSALACARTLCVVIEEAFAQVGGVEVSCAAASGAEGAAEITLRLPGGSVDWGHLAVCVAPRPGAQLRIDDFEPKSGPSGTEIALFGVFPSNTPQDFCVALKPDGWPIALDVLRFEDIDDDGGEELIARLPPLAMERIRGECQLEPIAYEPAPILVTAGRNTQLDPDRFNPDVLNVLEPVHVWEADGAQVVAADVFRPTVGEPDPARSSFMSERPVDGAVSVAIICLGLSTQEFEIRMKVFDSTQGTGVGLHVPRVSWAAGNARPAEFLCEAITTALALAGIDVECDEDLSNAPRFARVIVSDPAAGWDQGSLAVSVSPPFLPMPHITRFDPAGGTCGTRVTIEGCDFAKDPDDILVTFSADGSLAPLDVVEASEDRLVTAIPPCMHIIAPVPGSLMYWQGEGRRAVLEPDDGPLWAWTRQPPDTAVEVAPAPELFLAEICESVPDCSLSLAAEGGALSILLSRDWVPGSIVSVAAAAMDRTGEGHAMAAPGVSLADGGSPLECASRIADVITRSLAEIAGAEVDCVAEGLEDGSARITLRLPGTPIALGYLGVCVSPDTSNAPVITDFDPKEGPPGTEVTISGRRFDPEPLNICAATVDEFGRAMPLHVTASSATRIDAELGGCFWNQAGLVSAPVVVRLGEGVREMMPPVAGLGQRGPTWLWAASPDLPLPPPKAVSADEFEAPGNPEPPEGESWYGAEEPVNGELHVFLRGDWPVGSELEVSVSAHDEVQGLGGCLRAPSLVLEEGGSLLDSARRIAEFVEGSFTTHGVNVSSTAEKAPGGLADITLRLVGGVVDAGHFNVLVSTRRRRPPVVHVLEVEPTRFTTGDILRIVTGSTIVKWWPSYDICALVLPAPAAGKPGPIVPVPLRVIQSEPVPGGGAGGGDIFPHRQLRAVVGPVPPDVRAGQVRVMPGAGRDGPGSLRCDGILVGTDSWSWGPIEDAVPGPVGVDVEPFFSDPPPGTTWYFGEPAGNDRITVHLPDAWRPGARVTVTGRFLSCPPDEDDCKGYDFEHHRFTPDLPDGSPERCAELVCCLILDKWRELAEERPDALTGEVSCEWSPHPAGGAMITFGIEDEEGKLCPLDRSYLSVCVEDDGQRFLRGDCNADGAVNIADPQYLLNFLFLGAPESSCEEATDVNDEGAVNIADAQYLLNFLFLGGRQPDAPYPDCGSNPEGAKLGCEKPTCE